MHFLLLTQNNSFPKFAMNTGFFFFSIELFIQFISSAHFFFNLIFLQSYLSYVYFRRLVWQHTPTHYLLYFFFLFPLKLLTHYLPKTPFSAKLDQNPCQCIHKKFLFVFIWSKNSSHTWCMKSQNSKAIILRQVFSTLEMTNLGDKRQHRIHN